MNRSPDPPFRAGPARRVLHALVALAGWALFFYWWWIVLRRTSAHDIRFTLVFTAVAFVAVVGLTVWWALHNLRIFRTRGGRRRGRSEPTAGLLRDGVGREVRMPRPPEDCRTARVVIVRIENGAKVYLPDEAVRPPAGRSGTERP